VYVCGHILINQVNGFVFQNENQQVGGFVPANVEAAVVSGMQSLISIRAASGANAGTYKCWVTSADGSQLASSQVLLSVV